MSKRYLGIEAAVRRLKASYATDQPDYSTGIMACVRPDEPGRFTVEGGTPEEEVHLTLAYFGKITDEEWTETAREQIAEVVSAEIASGREPIHGEITAVTTFELAGEDEPPLVLLVDAPGLGEMRAALVRSVKTSLDPDQEIKSNHDFMPHITLCHGASDGEISFAKDLIGEKVRFDAVELAWGTESSVWPFGGDSDVAISYPEVENGLRFEDADVQDFAEPGTQEGDLMPYEIVEKHPECAAGDPYAVVKSEGGDLMGCHPSRQDAEEQLAALNAAEEGKASMVSADPLAIVIADEPTRDERLAALDEFVAPKGAGGGDAPGDTPVKKAEDKKAGDMIPCPTCDGTGKVDGKTCSTCDGTGEVPADKAAAPAEAPKAGAPKKGVNPFPPKKSAAADAVPAEAPKMVDCPECDGTGQVNGEKCPMCDGTGQMPEDPNAPDGMEDMEDEGAAEFKAVAVHHTPTSDGPWDGPANEKQVKVGEDESYYRAIFAWNDPEGDPKTKAAWRFIHHEVGADGAPGPANLKACSTGIGVLNGGMGGTTIPDADVQGVYEHLAAHLKDAEKEVPALASDEGGDSMAVAEEVAFKALPSHSSATKNPPAFTGWDGNAVKKNTRSGESLDYYGKIYAWVDSNGDPTNKTSYKFPHHEVSVDGTPGAAVLWAVHSAIAVIDDSTIPSADYQGVYNHLAKHLRDGGVEDIPELGKDVANSVEGARAAIATVRAQFHAMAAEAATKAADISSTDDVALVGEVVRRWFESVARTGDQGDEAAPVAADEFAAAEDAPAESDAPIEDQAPEGDSKVVGDFKKGDYEWEGVLIVEGLPSGDGRMIDVGVLTWRDLPVPLMLQTVNASYHDGAVIAGSICEIERKGHEIIGRGYFDSGKDGQEAKRLLTEGTMRGVSADIDSVVVELRDESGADVSMEDVLLGDPGAVMEVLVEGRVMGACYDDETEILSEDDGWVHFGELAIGERVATMNPKTGEFEWQEPTYYHHDQNWTGRMIRFSGRGLDLLVTPNHRMTIVDDDGVTHHVPAEDLIEKPFGRMVFTSKWTAPDVSEVHIEADQTPKGECACGCGESVVGVRSGESCSIEGCDRAHYGGGMCNKHYQRNVRHGDPLAGGPERSTINKRYDSDPYTLPGHGHGLTTEPLVVDGDDFAAMMGAWLAEGSLADGRRVVISQLPKSKGYAPYAELGARLGWTEMGTGFVWTNARMARYLQAFGHAHEKFVPEEIKSMSARQLATFLHHYLLGDGHYDGRRWRASTVSERLADDLMEIAQKVGMHATKRLRVPRDTVIEGRLIPVERQRPCWVVSFSEVDYLSSWKAEWVDGYVGDVRCVSVPNETLYVRRNGYPIWCSNTMTPFPAFQEAQLRVIDGDAQAEDVALVASGAEILGEVWRFTSPYPLVGHGMEPLHVESLVASAATVTELPIIPVNPPLAWFASEDDELDPEMPFTVLPNGRIYGLVARWGTCHIGFRDRCVQVPRSGDGYRNFRNKNTLTAEGELVATGPIYVDTVHPDLGLCASDAQAFYAHTGCAVGDVAMYENEFGILVAGAARPDVSAEKIRVLRGSDVSPDWRNVNGNLEVIGVLSVNLSGFIVPGLVASGAEEDVPRETMVPRGRFNSVTGQFDSLVAAGSVRRCNNCGSHSMGDDTVLAILEMLNEHSSRLAELSEVIRPYRYERLAARIAELGILMSTKAEDAPTEE